MVFNTQIRRRLSFTINSGSSSSEESPRITRKTKEDSIHHHRRRRNRNRLFYRRSFIFSSFTFTFYGLLLLLWFPFLWIRILFLVSSSSNKNESVSSWFMRRPTAATTEAAAEYQSQQQQQKQKQQRYIQSAILEDRRDQNHRHSSSSSFIFDASSSMKSSTRRLHSSCAPLDSWQETSFPTCNTLHEMDDWTLPHTFLDDTTALVHHGFIRDVWKVLNSVQLSSLDDEEKHEDAPPFLALKTLRWYKDFTPDIFNGQRFDALVSERLTSSPFVANIYGYCGFSALFDYSDQGNLKDHLATLSKVDRLRIAVEISSALADLHSIDDPELATVVHADIAVRQFIKDTHRNSFLLTDFNTASPLYYKYPPAQNNSEIIHQTPEQCPYHMRKALDRNRAPEEMMFEDDQEGGNPVSEKIDVYSLGNIFYHFITGYEKYEKMDVGDAQALVLKGHVPWIVSSLLNSSILIRASQEDEIDTILARAIQMCLVLDPHQRASAREVANFLSDEWERYRVRHGLAAQ